VINWRIISNPGNWINLAAMAVFWIAVAYLAAAGLHTLSTQNQGTPAK
jgi:hypothetical protein